MVLVLFPLLTTQTVSQPWLWALPFLFTFIGGVFADVFQMRQRKMFFALSGAILLMQAVLCLTLLPGIAR
jgi:cytochrome c-type biogenesis protein CcmH/NrfF